MAGNLLAGALYANYYDIDYAAILPSLAPEQHRKRWQFSRPAAIVDNAFAQLCAARAGVRIGTWSPATNGMIIEQQQILTIQNLAALFAGTGAAVLLRPDLGELAMTSFTWICRRQQAKVDDWHAKLIMIKNTAYAWRQMVFFLAVLPAADVSAFLREAGAHLATQSAQCQARLGPAMRGLELAVAGVSLDSDVAIAAGARRFTGWSVDRHWMLA